MTMIARKKVVILLEYTVERQHFLLFLALSGSASLIWDWMQMPRISRQRGQCLNASKVACDLRSTAFLCQGWTPLMHACARGADVIPGANFIFADRLKKDSCICLQSCGLCTCQEVVRVLVDFTAEIDARNWVRLSKIIGFCIRYFDFASFTRAT